ncbi:MAG TPA: ABC transporter six-transmembrane domain-containing protein [Bacteroidota bacterium]|nr:ABC transporter six-transmembrane domain-containing protein [Bacteroidota bacterium]
MQLIDLLKRFRKGIALAIGLVVLEHVAWIIEPAVFGKAIDALIDQARGDASNFSDIFLPLGLWIGVFLINSGTGVIRRVVDEKIFLALFSQLAFEISSAAKEKNLRSSKTAALAQLSEQYVTFFQYRVPEIIEQAIEISGAVIALAAFDWRISITCLTIILPLILMNRFYNRHVSTLQTTLHDTLESTYDVFSTQDPESIRTYYNSTSVIKQKIANWGAFNFGIMRMTLLAIFLVVLFIAIDLDDFTTGNIYSIVAYIWTFITSSEYLPELMESWTSLRDISKRLQKASL